MMGIEIDSPPGPSATIARWTTWLQNAILPVGPDAETLNSLFLHLADLGLFESCEGDHWRLSAIDIERPPQQVQKEVLQRLESLSRTERGFALRYFLGRPAPLSEILAGESSTSSPVAGETGGSAPQKASDLSNLQIVKKVGRQLKPFLDLEKKAISLLQGNVAGKQDAQRLFHYILGKSQAKATPGKWEQLSRKRHK